jgi:hypothetical protein
VSVAACAAAPAPEPKSPDLIPTDPTELYLDWLQLGDGEKLLASFAGEPAIDDPLAGSVRGAVAVRHFVADRAAWLRARAARLRPVRTTRAGGRTVVEEVFRLRDRGRDIELPIAVVGDRDPDGRLRAIRVYHSRWPLEGKHTVRPPLLPRDPTAVPTGIVAQYQKALAAGNVDDIVATFEPTGTFREPSGGVYVHRGQAAVRAFMTQILAAGGIGLEHATATDDGVVTALEFNAVSFGPRRLTPQAGLAVYERGPTGRLAAARIYDDINVEELAPAADSSP